jgi:arylsulfatase
MIAHWPAHIKAPRVVHAPCHVVDLLPTILEAGGVAYPKEFGGAVIQELDGESLMPALSGKDWTREQPLFWEHEGNSAVRIGNFKLVRKFNQPWELYDMEADRTELNNLMGKNDPLTTKLTHAYDMWAKDVGVLDWNEALPKLLKIWQMDDAHG